MITTTTEFAALNVGDAFTWACAKCGKIQTSIKCFESLPPADATCESCQKQRIDSASGR